MMLKKSALNCTVLAIATTLSTAAIAAADDWQARSGRRPARPAQQPRRHLQGRPGAHRTEGGGARADQYYRELSVRTWAIVLVASLIWPAVVPAQLANPSLVLEAKIPLGAVSGRIDHLGIDLKRQRLLVAELGNDSLGVVDLAAGKLLRTITGFSEPQGVAYASSADTVFVANGGDGSVRVLRGEYLAPEGRIELGDDADNVRVDTQRGRVLVGYGKGALAVIDPTTRTRVTDIRLKGHPEGFQIDETGTRVFANVPEAREIEVADLATAATRSLPTQGAEANFPMAMDRDARRVLVVFRRPPTLMVLSSQDGPWWPNFRPAGTPMMCLSIPSAAASM